eukprot:scaffold6260_cov209-Alexandrium_tamarense.AAC.2
MVSHVTERKLGWTLLSSDGCPSARRVSHTSNLLRMMLAGISYLSSMVIATALLQRAPATILMHHQSRCAFAARGERRKHTSTLVSTTSCDQTSEELIAQNNTKHFHCYLLRSLDPNHPLKTYIGYTTNPSRRIRQHNGILKNNGARRTKSARPWEYVAIIDGFSDKVQAMQFEWAWQHTGKSKVFRASVGCDVLARKMKRNRGVRARLEELSVLLSKCEPFASSSLRLHLFDEEYHNMFQHDVLLGEGDSLSENNATTILNALITLDSMPFPSEGESMTISNSE